HLYRPARPHRGAVRFRLRRGGGARSPRGFSQQNRPPADLIEAQTIEVDGTVLAGGFAVPADADAAVSRQRLLEKRHLFGRRFLHAQDVRLDMVEGRPEGMLSHGPIELLPRRPFAPTAMDIPGDYSDRCRVSLWRRGWPASAD